MKNFRNALISALALAFACANADLIDPNFLKNSPDGANDNVQYQINHMGFNSSVGLQSGNTIYNYGDQVTDRLFEECNGPMSWSIAYQFAGYGPHHKIGYYTDLGNASPAITWVIGGSASGEPHDAVVDVKGVFGLVLDSGDHGGSGDTLYFSEMSRNGPAFDHVAVIELHNGHENNNCDGEQCRLLTSWEDLNLGDHDYNDLGMIMCGARAVPEPASIAALAIGAVALVRRRRLSK